ncbi:MAG: GNAT family N-acetyltransferase [Actinobacteria bacterium]|nr:GNAT family N-acetyltransferase [Actinomycetota bacterium]
MTAPSPAARMATARDDAALAQSLSRAFADDPVWRFLVPSPRRWEAGADRFFRAELAALRRRGGEVWTVGGHAVAMWAAPDRWRGSPRELAGILPSGLRLFARRTPVALRALSTIEREHPRDEHWYLAVLGTDPDHQGNGLGSAVLQPVLERCDAEGIPAFLESSKERNLAFYARHGFVAGDPIELPGGGPPVWPMRREPR